MLVHIIQIHAKWVLINPWDHLVKVTLKTCVRQTRIWYIIAKGNILLKRRSAFYQFKNIDRKRIQTCHGRQCWRQLFQFPFYYTFVLKNRDSKIDARTHKEEYRVLKFPILAFFWKRFLVCLPSFFFVLCITLKEFKLYIHVIVQILVLWFEFNDCLIIITQLDLHIFRLIVFKSNERKEVVKYGEWSSKDKCCRQIHHETP